MGEQAPQTVRDLVRLGSEFLVRKGIESARLESELLVAHALGWDRLRVFLELDRPVNAEEVDRSRESLVRRSKGEPCAYITGVREFYGRDFEVTPDVLIPRPESELLVDLARERLRAFPAAGVGARVLDLGTGSGCLGITLALECQGSHVVACDVSAAALAVARRNAERLGADLEFLESDGLGALEGQRFDLLVSNPPYVSTTDQGALADDVRAFEPALALFAPDGAPDHWAQRLSACEGLADPPPRRLIELGFDQAARLEPWLRGRGQGSSFHTDSAGVKRVLEVPEAPQAMPPPEPVATAEASESPRSPETP